MTDTDGLYYAIGTTTGNMQTFDILGVIAPFQEPFVPFTVEIAAADSLVYGHGWSRTKMHWGFISQEQRNTLKTFCTGKSASVYIRVKDDSWQWVYCQATMIWQEENPPDNGYILDFSVLFNIIENYGASLP